MSDRRSILRIRLLTVVTALVVYEIVARSGVLYQGVLPPLWRIGVGIVDAVTAASTYANLAVTASEVTIGFAVGTSAGIAVGLLTGSRPWVGAAVGPYLDGLATAPKIIFFPIAILAFGVGPSSKAALGALSAFFPVALTVAAAVRRMNPVYVRVGRSFNLSPWQMTTKVYLPALLPSVANGMRLGLGLSIIGVLLGEAKLADRGIGFLAIDDYNNYRVAHMYALLILIFALAIAANVVIGRLEAGRSAATARRNEAKT